MQGGAGRVARFRPQVLLAIVALSVTIVGAMVLIPAVQAAPVIRINAGGPAQTVGDVSWAGCTTISDCNGYVSGGFAYTEPELPPIINAAAPLNEALYQTEWTGGCCGPNPVAVGATAFEFNIPVANGAYAIRLHFAELNKNGAGLRVFDVNIEGGPLELSGFDIFVQAGGMRRAITQEFQATVADGNATITFIRQVENAKISAIEIVPLDAPTATSEPASPTISGDAPTVTATPVAPSGEPTSESALHTPTLLPVDVSATGEPPTATSDPPTVAVPSPTGVPATPTTTNAPFKILVFSKTAAFRHDSIPQGIAAIKELGTQHGFAVDTSEDGAAFTDQNLAQYKAVIFLSTTGDVLNDAQQATFERYIRAGGGYVGIHAASDTEYNWPWYGQLVGAYFKDHPAIQQASVRVEDRSQPSTVHLPELWARTDEWYNFRANPRPQVQVLATLDETSYAGGNMGDHPIAWQHPFDGGRAWYTGGGHTRESFADPAFRLHVLGGIQYAAGVAEAPTPTATPQPPMPTSSALPTTTTSPSPTSSDPTTTYSFTPAADTFVSAYSAGTSYGTTGELQVLGGNTYTRQAFLRFNVTDLPPGAMIGKATLRLVVTDPATHGGVLATTSNTTWNENITWRTKPPIDGATIATLPAVGVGQAIDVDVTAAVRGHGPVSFALSMPSAVENRLGYAARESATTEYRPQLIIATGTGSTPTGTAVAPSPEPSATATITPPSETGWTPLFNGQNLDGWYTWLPSTGKNNDPKGVFKVRDGMLHILGIPVTGKEQEFGYIATTSEYSNYRLRFQYRWGGKRFAPRATDKRDSGLLYHMVGPDKIWPRSMEAQVQEGDTGDFFMLGNTGLSTTVESTTAREKKYKERGVAYSQTGGRIIKSGTYDSLTEWNTVEVIVSGNEAVHIVNGVVNNRGTNFRQPDPGNSSRTIALSKGRILFQAEGAEIFYRNIEIQTLPYTPAPDGATTLFNGGSTSQWQPRNNTGSIAWPVADGALEVRPGSGDIRSTQTFGDMRLHLELKVPSTGSNTEQERGNSGIFVQGRYEIQILDSFNRSLSGADDQGAIYGQRDAAQQVSLPSETWQAYDIVFRAARWSNGVKAEDARISVWLNGALIHQDVVLPGSTAGGDPEGAAAGPIVLQDHGSRVRFRNIWVQPLN